MGTNIAVSDQVWSELNSRKRPGESFDDVLRRVLNIEAELVSSEPAPPTSPPIELPEGLPGNKDDDAMRAAIAAAVELVRARKAVTAREFVAELIEEHPFDYDVAAALATVDAGERYRGGWWRSIIKPGLEAHPDVQKPPRGGSEWTWVGEK